MHSPSTCSPKRGQATSGETVADSVLADLALVGVETVTEMGNDFLKESGRLKVQHRLSLVD